MSPTLLKIAHFIGMTNLTEDEVKKYCDLHLAKERGDSMFDAEEVIGGKLYRTKNSTCIMDYCIKDSYRLKLYRTANGNYFHISIHRWMNSWATCGIKPMGSTHAIDMFMDHKGSALEPFEKAFPGMKLEEA